MALDQVRGVFSRPLSESARGAILAACEGDAWGWENARTVQIGPSLSLGFAVIKEGQPCRCHSLRRR